ncbi:Uncharacterised protein [uncultured archaeon]|nr:Uncharacterised protein [uncultured archaeon]
MNEEFEKPPKGELTDRPVPPKIAKAKEAKVAAKAAAKAAAARKGKTVLIINGDNDIHFEDDQSVLAFTSAFQNMGDEVRVELAKDTSYSTWGNYDIVVWSCGDDYSAIGDVNNKQMLVDYVSGGGCLILEGGNIAGWCKEFGAGTIPNRMFREKVLYATTDWVYHDVGDLKLKNPHPIATTPNSLPETIGFTPTEPGDGSGDANAVRILPDATGIYNWSYVAYNGNLVRESVSSISYGLIACESENGGRIVYYAFDIDDIDNPDIQQKLIQNSADWLRKTSNPSALIISSKGQLVEKYGEDGFNQIEQKINDYIQALNNAGLLGNLIYVDDENCLSPFELNPVDPKDANKIKELLDDLDRKLVPSTFLILGGHSIIPFHIIDNPCGNDGDSQVYSDNPYASRNEDILIPERSLGRLPDDSSTNVTFLISLLETITSRIKKAKKSSFGLSAKVWKEASEYVYDAIKYGQELKLSPPVLSNNLKIDWINDKGYFYFNLHGSEETPNWYGQENSRYPVAFSPDNLANTNVENAVICTEACYGANIIDKSVDEAISLKFLERKAACFVGSTKIAYGPSEPPSTDADLIVLKFYEHIKEGLTFGEAFIRAKKDFADETIRRLGYLDETGKKTLLEFVMFADPALKMEETE